MKHIAFVLVLTTLPIFTAHAQHLHDEHEESETDGGETRDRHGEMRSVPKHGAMEMSSVLLPNLPMQRDGSGTSWHPDTSPMYGVHTQAGTWNFMFHGRALLRYTSQDVFEDGIRGDSKVDGPNWFMVMGHRRIGKRSQLSLRGMFTLEPLTEGRRGFPLLFQTGETIDNRPLIDTQHPHDLFAELSVAFGHSLSDKAGFYLYFGMPGEPALGPPTFMHRPSARHNPDPPISHHWQDASHITFGVATLGLRYGMFKIDGSVFTGREPNEERYKFDRPRFDSYSVRLSANPSDRLSFQVSRALMKSPEVIAPDLDLWRTTVSALYVHNMTRQGTWATTVVWGMNELAGNQNPGQNPGGLPKLGSLLKISRAQHITPAIGLLRSLLLESDLQIGKQAFYTRVEWVEKSASDLGLGFLGDREFAIGTLTFGASRDLITFGNMMLMLGAQGTTYKVPEEIQVIYGSRPISVEVYLGLSPIKILMRHGHTH